MGLSERSPFQVAAAEFERLQHRASNALIHHGAVKSYTPAAELKQMVHVVKQAAAGVIVSPHDLMRVRTLNDIGDLPIGLQVRKEVMRDRGQTGGTLECPGGAWETDEETEKIKSDGLKRGVDVPGNLFYQILHQKLLDGDPTPTFGYNKVPSGRRLETHVRRELEEEMGKKAASHVRLSRALNQSPHITDLTILNFDGKGESEKNQQVVDKYGDSHSLSLKKSDAGSSIRGAVQRVEEHVMWADVDDVTAVAERTVSTPEASGMFVYTVDELFELFELATEGDEVEDQRDAWINFKKRHPGRIRPRAPSTAWQIRMLFEYLDRNTQQAHGSTASLRCERGVLEAV